MIEKLNRHDFLHPLRLQVKINELIEAHNRLQERHEILMQNYDEHNHSYEDHATSGPVNK